MEEVVRTARAYAHGDYEPRSFEPLKRGGRSKKPRYVGVYRCASCSRALFSTEDCLSIEGVRALFNTPFAEDAVKTEKNYDSTGNEHVRVLCAGCSAQLGTLGSVSFASATDLEQGTEHHYYHIDLARLRLRKALAARNYPLVTILISAVLLAGVYWGWVWVNGLVHTASYGNMSGKVTLWADDTDIQVTAVHLDRATSTDRQGMEEGPLLVVLPTNGGIPRIRFANHPIDIVWLDVSFRVLDSIQGRAADSAEPLTPPSGAVFMLVGAQGTLPQAVFASGLTLFVPDRTQLL